MVISVDLEKTEDMSSSCTFADTCTYNHRKPELETTHKDHQCPTFWCLQKQLCKLIIFVLLQGKKISSNAIFWMHKKKESFEDIFGG